MSETEREIVSHAERESERQGGKGWAAGSMESGREEQEEEGGRGGSGMLMQSTDKCGDEALSMTDEDVW